MEDGKIFDEYLELPDGYQVQMMVLKDFPGGVKRRGARMDVFRSRIWIGHASESEPIVHRSQEHTDGKVAIDACYSMLLSSADAGISSVGALDLLRQRVDTHFCRASRAM